MAGTFSATMDGWLLLLHTIGQVTNVRLSGYLVLLLVYRKTRQQDCHTSMTSPIYMYIYLLCLYRKWNMNHLKFSFRHSNLPSKPSYQKNSEWHEIIWFYFYFKWLKLSEYCYTYTFCFRFQFYLNYWSDYFFTEFHLITGNLQTWKSTSTVQNIFPVIVQSKFMTCRL